MEILIYEAPPAWVRCWRWLKGHRWREEVQRITSIDHATRTVTFG